MFLVVIVHLVRLRAPFLAVALDLSADGPIIDIERALGTVRVLADLYTNELRPWRLGAAMFGAFGALAVALAAVGLYGVISFSVAQRTREMGVRIALGARAERVLALVLRQGLALAAAGGAVGLVAALLASRWVEPLLFRVPARDPAVLAAVAITLGVVALAATLIPAWRATRVDPAVALRGE